MASSCMGLCIFFLSWLLLLRSGGYDSDCGGHVLRDSVGLSFSHLQAVLVLMAAVHVQVLGVQISSHLRSSGLEVCLSSDTQNSDIVPEFWIDK